MLHGGAAGSVTTPVQSWFRLGLLSHVLPVSKQVSSVFFSVLTLPTHSSKGILQTKFLYPLFKSECTHVYIAPVTNCCPILGVSPSLAQDIQDWIWIHCSPDQMIIM